MKELAKIKHIVKYFLTCLEENIKTADGVIFVGSIFNKNKKDLREKFLIAP